MLNDEVRARGAGQAENQRRGRGDTNANLFATNVVKAWFIGLGDLSCVPTSLRGFKYPEISEPT